LKTFFFFNLEPKACLYIRTHCQNLDAVCMWVCMEIYIHIHIYRLSIIDCCVRLQGTSSIPRSVSPWCMIKMNNLKQSVILIDKFQGSPKPSLLFFFSRGRCVYVVVVIIIIIIIITIIIRNFRGPYEVRQETQ
jgi:hypothetical protein